MDCRGYLSWGLVTIGHKGSTVRREVKVTSPAVAYFSKENKQLNSHDMTNSSKMFQVSYRGFLVVLESWWV